MNPENVIFFGAALAALALGCFIYLFPEKTFDIQKRFYALINWNIEPISLKKEIRNTRVMGVILIAFVIGACIYQFSP